MRCVPDCFSSCGGLRRRHRGCRPKWSNPLSALRGIVCGGWLNTHKQTNSRGEALGSPICLATERRRPDWPSSSSSNLSYPQYSNARRQISPRPSAGALRRTTPHVSCHWEWRSGHGLRALRGGRHGVSSRVLAYFTGIISYGTDNLMIPIVHDSHMGP